MHVPATIGRYPVSALIGTGAFSAVYRAVDERLGNDVAIKLLGDHHSLDPEIRERFIAEARLLRRVSSPHVVQLYDLDETDRHQPFHVLELIAGGNLWSHRRSMSERGRVVTAEDAILVVDAVTEALVALHAERIVHRDLTPTNLLLRQGRTTPSDGPGLLVGDEQLVLADLGLSKDLAVSSGLTAAGGTDGFAAPEQRAAGTVDERTDVYAASALLTWLLLGRPPGPTDAAELVGAGWSESLRTALSAGLAADPADRPASIGRWRDEVLASLAPPTVAPPPPSPARRTRRSLVIGSLVTLLAAVGGYAAATITEDGDGPDTTTTELADGRVLIERTENGVTAAFDGPATLLVGEPATFGARVGRATTWMWLDDDGAPIVRATSLAVTPTSAGQLPIRLLVVPPNGTPIVLAASFPVRDPADEG